MTTIFITGGAGFIGSNFVRYIVKKYPAYKVINLDKLTYAGNLENLRDIEDNPNYTFVHGDICDKEKVFKIMAESDLVIHFAAETHVDRSVLDAGQFITTDVYGTFVMLEAVKKYKPKKFLHISTDEVYGDVIDEPCKEGDPLYPKSPYAASKAGADRLVYSYYKTYDVPIVITRCCNNYGPYQYPEKLIPLFITNLLEGKKVPVYGTGKNTREWIHDIDHCEALDAILHADGYYGEVFNIGTGEEFCVLEITKLILDYFSKSEEWIEFIEDRPGHVLRHAINSEKFLNTFRIKPNYSLASCVDEIISWYVDSESWWKNIKEKQKDYIQYYDKQYNQRKKK
ncbi:dTDP-glucose 4,6-dehydratase [bacterium]|nr:dTDP-glucose 4,6-dehydratase [bacterium]